MTVDPTRCPGCGAVLTGAPACPSCGLPLRGPLAAQLWQVSTEIDRLEGVRARLLDTLRRGSAAAPPPARVSATVPAPAPAPAPRPAPAFAWEPAPRPAPTPRKEWTPQRVQNLLLATGALLLVVAAIAFTAFTWGRLPIAARGAIMLAVTGVAGWSARWVHRRGLEASAEAIALLTVLFGAVDAYAARRANLAGLASTDAPTYWSFATAALAAGSAAFARVLPVRSLRYAALASAQLPLVITALRLDGLNAAERGAFLAVQAAGLGAVAFRLGGTALAARICGAANWAVAAVLALGTAYAAESGSDVRLAALVLAATGAVALLWPGDRTLPAAVTTVLCVLAAVAPAAYELTFVQLPAAVAAIGLLVLVGAASVPYTWRTGPLLVGTATVAVALAAVVPWAVQALVLPLSWVETPWRITADAPVREVISADGTVWGGSVVALAVVAVATLAAGVTAYALGRLRAAYWWVVGLASVAVLLVPLGFAMSYRVALAWYLVAGIATLIASTVLQRVLPSAIGTVVLAVATAWSLADEGMTLLVLLVVTIAYAAYATAFARPREIAAGIASAGAAAYAVALAASRGAPTDRIGFVLATASFGLLAAGAVIDGRARSVEGVGALAYAVALGLSVTGVGWFAWTLGGGALAAGVTAFRPGRRYVAGVAAALTAGCAAATSLAFGLAGEQAGFVVAATACALFAAGSLARLDDVRWVGALAYACGAVAAAGDVEWLAWALGIGALTAAAAAYRDRELSPVAAALAVACAGTTSAALGAPLDRTAFVVAVAAALAVGAGALLRGNEGDLTEVVGATAYTLSVGLALPDLGWLSWVLAVGGVTALADALRPERRWLNWVATILLTAWSWDRLWLEDVRVPEAYAAPVAALTLVLGYLHRRRDPSVGSWQAYGRGLGIAFTPTTYLVLSDPGVTRPVLLAVAGVAVLLAGVSERLQAPLTIGAAALAVDAIVQLAPVAVALPKWATIGAAGLLVIAVGVTYEDRRRDMARLRETFDSLA